MSRKLIELAAKAAGVDYDPEKSFPKNPNSAFFGLWLNIKCEPYEGQRRRWNPLKDDGDALRLAATLRLNIMQGEFSVAVGDEDKIDEAVFVPDESQRLFAIRESIVRAAAEIGRATP